MNYENTYICLVCGKTMIGAFVVDDKYCPYCKGETVDTEIEYCKYLTLSSNEFNQYQKDF